jgi:hypothetical protein
MSAINVLTFPDIVVFSRACCECVRERAETHVPVLRAPMVSARWTVEITDDGTRRLVQRWSINQTAPDARETSGLPTSRALSSPSKLRRYLRWQNGRRKVDGQPKC